MMSIALKGNSSVDLGIERPGFVHGMKCSPIYESPEFSIGDDGFAAKDVDSDEQASSCTSSIGRNSDDSPAGRSLDADGDGEEVQSSFKGGVLDNLQALEEVLPIKRGISNFYAGKSKSFTSLSHAASSTSLKDIVKPENAYTRKRKNLVAHNIYFSKNGKQNNGNGLYKRPTNSRSSLALAATQEHFPPLPPHPRKHNIESSSSPPHKQKFSNWRSFSLFDLQGVGDGSLNNLSGTKG